MLIELPFNLEERGRLLTDADVNYPPKDEIVNSKLVFSKIYRTTMKFVVMRFKNNRENYRG